MKPKEQLTARLIVMISPQVRKRLKTLAAARGESVGCCVREALEAMLKSKVERK